MISEENSFSEMFLDNFLCVDATVSLGEGRTILEDNDDL